MSVEIYQRHLLVHVAIFASLEEEATMDWDRIEGNWKLHAAPWVKGGIGVALSELTALGSESRPGAHEIPRKPHSCFRPVAEIGVSK